MGLQTKLTKEQAAAMGISSEALNAANDLIFLHNLQQLERGQSGGNQGSSQQHDSINALRDRDRANGYIDGILG